MPFAASCSGGDDGPAGGEDGGTGVVQAPLHVAYDEVTGRLQIYVMKGVAADNVYVRIRTRVGNLKVDSFDAMDCADLSSAAKVELTRQNRVATGGLIDEDLFQGPAVPKALLSAFYETTEIPAEPGADLLALIDRGTDSIVEACLLRDGGDEPQVLGKVQTTVLRAWDDAVGNRLERVRAVENGGAADPLAVMHSVSTYGALCEAEMGPIPFFPAKGDGTHETFDCTKGSTAATVPITVTDGAGNAQDQTTEPPLCDRPDWLRGSCAPFVRVHRMTNEQGTRWVLLCRKPPKGQTAASTTFNDIAMIGSNPTTGKTCFFQNGLYAKTDAAHLPSPADRATADAMWSSFNAALCHDCHDADPWIHSPWVDQAKYPDGSFVVPRIGDDKAYPQGSPSPYELVGRHSMGWRMHKYVTSSQAAACTGCHRLADGSSLAGQDGRSSSSWTARSTGNDTDFFQGRVTASYRAFAKSHWMPPSLAGLTEANWNNSEYGKAVRFLQQCVDSDANCAFADLPSR